jgi:aryl-alcohol dehydrogenase-like predicted oxidoreductase
VEYIRLGKTGLKVSRLCLGCVAFGEATEQRPWALSMDEARPIVRRAVEAGITFFDTANSYQGGTSEAITGSLLREFAARDTFVIASKVFNRMAPDPNGAGLSRKAILREIEGSLRRLGTDYIDLYQIHRWDYETPIEETLEALNDCVRAGKVRYIGASSMFAWQLFKALHVSRMNQWAEFVSMQNEISLIYREEEREMLPLCRDQGIGVVPWSPVGGGMLTRPWGMQTRRSTTDATDRSMYARHDDPARKIVEALAVVAEARQVPMARVALAWVLRKPEVTAPIFGATRVSHVEDALSAFKLELSSDEIAALELPYRPGPIRGNL